MMLGILFQYLYSYSCACDKRNACVASSGVSGSELSAIQSLQCQALRIGQCPPPRHAGFPPCRPQCHTLLSRQLYRTEALPRHPCYHGFLLFSQARLPLGQPALLQLNLLACATILHFLFGSPVLLCEQIAEKLSASYVETKNTSRR
jgi:hypothetical protein